MESGYHRKRKRALNHHQRNGTTDSKSHHDVDASSNGDVDTSKPTAVFKPTTPRTWTVSIAVPGSIIANAQTHDLKTSLAATIARCAAVFSIDEIIVFDDGTAPPSKASTSSSHASQDSKTGYTAFSDPSHFLVHILTYLETPPYLRKALIGFHPNLRTAGMCPSLDMPHHCQVEETGRWREGMTLASSSVAGNPIGEEGREGTYVDIGSSTPVFVSEPVPPGVRVTLDLGDKSSTNSTTPSTKPKPKPKTPHSHSHSHSQTAKAVSPTLPRETDGLYTGYTVRRAPSLSAIFTSPPEDYLPTGYNYCIGTSERGDALPSFLASHHSSLSSSSSPLSQNPIENNNDTTAPKTHFQHLLIAFGGVAGLEAAVANDTALKERGVGPKRAREVFDAWVDLVPGQGSRTVRTEEAVWLGCAGLRGLWV